MSAIILLSGIEKGSVFPRFIEASGLTHRTAVIQETDAGGNFDEYLWRRVFEFIGVHFPRCVTAVFWTLNYAKEKSEEVSTLLQSWDGVDPDNRHLPRMLLTRSGGRIDAVLIKEDWEMLGGEYPYADSYTYSLFSSQDLTLELRQFLAEVAVARGWDIYPETLTA